MQTSQYVQHCRYSRLREILYKCNVSKKRDFRSFWKIEYLVPWSAIARQIKSMALLGVFILGTPSIVRASCDHDLLATIRDYEEKMLDVLAQTKKLPTSGIKTCEFYKNEILPLIRRNIDDLTKFSNCSAYQDLGAVTVAQMEGIYTKAEDLTEKTCDEAGK